VFIKHGISSEAEVYTNRSGNPLAAHAAFRCTGSLVKAAFGLKVPDGGFVPHTGP